MSNVELFIQRSEKSGSQLFVCVCVFQLLLMNKEIDMRELDFLLRFNIDHSYISPVDFLSNSAWSAIKVLHTHTPVPDRYVTHG